MPTCTEFAVFEVKHANLARVLALSESLFAEINTEQKNIVAHEILVKTAVAKGPLKEQLKENSVEGVQEVCWHLTWANVAAVEASSSKWSTYPSAAEIERLVGKKLYYGHFVSVIAK
ncbi:hypothetical protein CMT41_07225 [Colwellia sp. MT41]|uniref:hypothetical protein n=1 Tax=Colwellia sp. MT41 TaxID=58049 RepID=UPI0007176EF9|nr:hypothetical protein [Colwellia sp. MT41]ALO34528.1 hypothetical protein CMT41_07225 [Colwellia sp. MT41]